MAWLYLSAACVFEIVWIVAMKYSEGFTRLWPTVITLVTSVVSFVLLAQAVGGERSVPVGTGYTVLNGAGTAGAVIFGIMLFNESAHPFRIVCVVMIVAGVMGLKLTME